MSEGTITVGGLPGTGTTTLSRILADETDLPYTYAGQLFRDAADDKGMSLAEFGALCQEDPSVDMDLDDRQRDLLAGPPCLLEGRLAGWFAYRAEVDALKVWLVCDDDERIRRMHARDGRTVEEQARLIEAREASERDRYLRYYDIDLGDLSIYDLVLDSTAMQPDQLAEEILTRWTL